MALSPFHSHLIADIGISFGDEGKGRVISEVIRELQDQTGTPDPVQVVLKVNGGANSGHTAGGLKLNLLPAGVIEETVPWLALGSGVVASPRKLLWETMATESLGFAVASRLAIDERTMISDLSHRLLDLAWENYRVRELGEEPRGSTGRGITPAYMEEVGQWQMTFTEFLGSRENFERRMAARLQRAVDTIQHVCHCSAAEWEDFFRILTEAELRANSSAIASGVFPASEFDFSRFAGREPFTLNVDAVVETYWAVGQQFRDAVVDVRDLILKTQANGKYIIGEYGQAFWLDKRHGFPPNVTASHTFTPEFFQSAGVPVQPIHTLGVCKAYDTKVGTHVFLTQMDTTESLFRKLAAIEFGTSTGRQRMVGWFDAVERGTALRYGGFNDLVLNKLDALTAGDSWKGQLKVCVAYEDDSGKRFWRVPRHDPTRKSLRPVYETCETWDEDISRVRSFDDLPLQAKHYVALLLRATIQCASNGGHDPVLIPNLRYIGVGPNPDEIIKDIPPTSTILEFS
jgi:adenylosuccinate synthase